MIKNIFIDLDDTLWDTRQNNKDAMKELFEEKNWSENLGNFEEWYEGYARHNDYLWDEYRKGNITKGDLILRRLRESLSPGLGELSDSEILEINKQFLDYVGQRGKVLEGTKEFLEQLKGKYKIVVLSNGFREVQTNKMRSAGLLPYIDFVVLSEDAGANKPNRQIFDYAFEMTGSRPSETIMIGDNWAADIEGAQNAHIPSIWFNPLGKIKPQESKFLRPIYEIKNLEEIVPLLNTINAFF